MKAPALTEGEVQAVVSAWRAGVKDDDGKPMMSLIFRDFPRALEAIGEVGTYGARKYAPHGWSTVPDAQQRYSDATMRHMLAYFRGQPADPESGLSHLAHFAWGALCMLELELRNGDR